jgi:hypothetical protein
MDPLAVVKAQAAKCWVDAVNADGRYGYWHYAVAMKPEEVSKCIEEGLARIREGRNILS